MNSLEVYNYVRKFTELYKSTDDIYERELKCTELQFEYMFVLPYDNDLIVGRKQELAVGLLPQADCGFTFYANFYIIDEALRDSSLTEAQREELSSLRRFWSTENTNAKTFKAYPDELKNGLCNGCIGIDKGVSFPLYRLAGAQFDVSRLLQLGVDGFIKEIREKYPENRFYSSCIAAMNIVKKTCAMLSEKIAAAAEERKLNETGKQNFRDMAEIMKFISSEKPVTFRQAQQLAFIYYIMSGTFNYGRMDNYLTEYFYSDISSGRADEEEIIKLIMSQWDIIIERNKKWDSRVILGGRDIADKPGIAQFQKAVMEASRRTKDVVPQLTLRCYEGMDESVYQKALDVIGEGTTFPMLYNDGVNIPAVEKAFETDRKTAEQYLPFGCGEYVIYNQSYGTPSGAINVLSGLNDMLFGEKEILTESETFDDFYNGYMKYLTGHIELLAKQEKLEYEVAAAEAPFLLLGMMYDDCLERGKPIFDGGIRYLGGTLESYGNTNTADSLAAVKKYVYEEKTISKKELQQALENNFKGYEGIRRMLLAAPKYGNDDDYVDSVAERFHIDLCSITKGMAEKVGLSSYLIVVINNSMNTTFGAATDASADGRPAHTFMANANNPSGGMDKQGITAMLNSLVKLPVDVHAGSVQNMRFSKNMFTKLQEKTKILLRAYFENGGSQSMITVLNRGDLEEAMVNPQKYANLIVRVGGFSAKFVELTRDVQEEILSRTLYE